MVRGGGTRGLGDFLLTPGRQITKAEIDRVCEGFPKAILGEVARGRGLGWIIMRGREAEQGPPTPKSYKLPRAHSESCL